MKKEYLPVISLVICGGVLINELSWIGKSSLAGVIIAIAIATGLNSLYLMKGK